MELTYRKEGKYLIFNRNGEALKYDLSNGSILRIRGDVENYMKSSHKFFKGISPCDLTKILNDDFEEVLDFVSYIHSRRFSNAGTLLHKLQQFIKLESYIKIGLKSFLKRIYRAYYGGVEKLHKLPELKDVNGKFIKFMNYENVMDKISDSNISEILDLMKSEEDTLFFITICDLIDKHNLIDKDEIFYYSIKNYQSIKKCVNKYSCNLSSLLNYMIFRIETMENYGGRSWSDYLDYLDMQTKIVKIATEKNPDLIISSKIEKYPKYLKTQHDIVVKIYNNYIQEYPEDIFKAMVNYKLEQNSLPYKLMVVMPKSSQEVKDEGVYMGHCVGSYVDSIIKGDRQVAFLRYEKEPNVPLITLDIKDGIIQQYEGKNRRAPNEKEWEAIEKYAKIKKLKLK